MWIVDGQAEFAPRRRGPFGRIRCAHAAGFATRAAIRRWANAFDREVTVQMVIRDQTIGEVAQQRRCFGGAAIGHARAETDRAGCQSRQREQ